MFEMIAPEFANSSDHVWEKVPTNLSEAVRCLDEQFGGGYAKRHPILTGLFSLACAIDAAGATLAGLTNTGLDAVASAINNVAFPDVNEEIFSLVDAKGSMISEAEDR
jgi:hypothetical protein